MRDVMDTLLAGTSLTRDQAAMVFDRILDGSLEEPVIGAILALIQSRRPSVDELVGAAGAMRRRMTPVPVDLSRVEHHRAGDPPPVVIDTCSTGGAPKVFNVSTCAAIVVAAAAPGRVLVAKHGNRSRTGRGSAEVLARLGVNIDAEPEIQARCLHEVGVCFCFAIRHHPAARHAAPARRALGFPTIFNLLGPLTNPASASRQLVGVYDPELARRVAEALARLGADRALVVHSADGLDELTITDRTHLNWVEGGSVRTELFDPASVGLERCSIEDLRAGGLDEATALIGRILDAHPGPPSDIVCLCAGAALCVAGAAATIQDGLAVAREAIGDGSARRTLQRLAEVSNAT